MGAILKIGTDNSFIFKSDISPEGKFKIEDITEQMISDNLYTANQPDPDLLIRTSGELRLSNFLPWQLAYTEFLFVDKNWPDFNEKDLDDAIEVYKSRNRKFGAK